ncbi:MULTISPECIES: thioredoxin family protein [Kamptonema]|uniref:thioredoxin family protein n=1 Tax=Kamptonema TaxID=1501433 RepID=UPI0001DACF09|nr:MULTISPECIES: thioredoxin family protein [Kamptonema]CBN56389.1 Alkyl hydroperoxide reductase/ Thiol specific antioxidant/ Mal allergen [Kamptonema sp. PCC 6506]
MNNRGPGRRKLLWYLGLGVGGTAISFGLKKEMMSTATPTSSSTNIPILTPPKSDISPTTERAITSQVGQILPEFQGISQWLNSPPLKISDLKGSVVLVQFWTFACINCQRTLPYITRWHRQYAERGLKIIGIHTPEFPFERDVNNVKKALKEYQITYPVPLDNEFKTWLAYKNEYWPHLFLADRQGIRRYNHIGEGAYDETEQTIRQLLG